MMNSGSAECRTPKKLFLGGLARKQSFSRFSLLVRSQSSNSCGNSIVGMQGVTARIRE